MVITCTNHNFHPTIHSLFAFSVLVMEHQQTMSDPQATRRFRFKVLIICFFSLLGLALVIALIVHLVRRPWGRKWYKYRKHYWWKRSDQLITLKRDQILDLRGVGRQAELVYGTKSKRSLSRQDSVWKRAQVVQLQ